MSALAPVYKKMRDDIRSLIEGGSLSPGEALPSENELARKYGISRGSTRVALSELEAEKLIEKKPGKGTIVSLPENAAAPTKPKMLGIDIAGRAASGYGYYQDFAYGAGEACREFNCRLQLVSDEDLNNIDKVGLDGLIIMRAYTHENLAAIAEKIPVTLVNKRAHDDRIGYVGIDDAMEAFRATEYLIRHGHERVAFIGGANPDGASRQKGYVSALKTYGLPIDKQLIIARNPDRMIFDDLKDLIERTRPTALLAASGWYFMSFVDPIARASRIRIPDDLSLISFDDIETACFHYGPPLTCVRQPLAEMGRAVVEMMANYSGEPIRRKFHAELVIRQSCRDIKRPEILIEERAGDI